MSVLLSVLLCIICQYYCHALHVSIIVSIIVLRYIETKPHDSEICPLRTDESPALTEIVLYNFVCIYLVFLHGRCHEMYHDRKGACYTHLHDVLYGPLCTLLNHIFCKVAIMCINTYDE